MLLPSRRFIRRSVVTRATELLLVVMLVIGLVAVGISSTAFAGERERTCAKAAVIGGAAGYYSTSPTAPPEEKRKNAETWAGAAYATCYVTYPH